MHLGSLENSYIASVAFGCGLNNSSACFVHSKLLTGVIDWWCTNQWALCTIRSYGTKSHMLVSKLHSGTSKTKQLVPVYLNLPLFWKSHCATCSPAYVILYHVTGSCKGPIVTLNSMWLLHRMKSARQFTANEDSWSKRLTCWKSGVTRSGWSPRAVG